MAIRQSALLLVLSVFYLVFGASAIAQTSEVAAQSELGVQYDTAVQMYKEKRYQEAEKALRQLLAERPEHPQGHASLGLTLLELNRWDEAQAELTRAEQIYRSGPSIDQINVGLGRVALKKGEIELALSHLNQAAESNPNNRDAYHYKGLAHTGQEDYQSALADFEKALQLDPSHAYSHYYAGMVCSRLNRPDKMIDHFQKFLMLAPQAPEAAKVQSLLRSVR